MKLIKKYLPFIIFSLVLVIADLFFLLTLKQYSMYSAFIWGITIVLFASWGVLLSNKAYFLKPDRFKMVMRLIGISLLNYIPKIIFIPFFVLFFIFRGLHQLIEQETVSLVFLSISEIFLNSGIFLLLVVFIAIVHGIIRGRFLFRIKRITIPSDDLPPSFEGLKVVQLSDFHIGSFLGHVRQVEKAIDKVLSLNPDIIFFTGDLTTVYADEVEPFLPALKKLNAPLGMYSVLGNHSYGGHDYFAWNETGSPEENLKKIKAYHGKMGFQLLNNESATINLNGDAIAVVGIENWGLPPFPQRGDYHKAAKDVDDIPFKILLSHDPSFWEHHVEGKINIPLTLSGHTHAMQMGVELGNFKWSPASFKYKYWGGLYKNEDSHLYVNRGFGHVLFPARIGLFPEITLLELKKK